MFLCNTKFGFFFILFLFFPQNSNIFGILHFGEHSNQKKKDDDVKIKKLQFYKWQNQKKKMKNFLTLDLGSFFY